MTLGAVRTATAVTMYVDASAVGANNGTSWTDAYKELQSALSAAGDNDEIYVAAGTYKPDYNVSTGTRTGDRRASFALKNNVTLYGGFPAGGGAWSSRDPAANETILSGDLAGDDGADFANYSDNTFHVVFADNVDATAVLDGFVITAGNANGGDYTTCAGGGLRINEGDGPTVAFCNFRKNWAYQGAGLESYYATQPVITSCVFIENAVNDYGGGLILVSGNPVLSDCTFTRNHSGYIGGGCMIHFRTSASFEHCTFDGNTARIGGGIYGYVESPTYLYQCTFTNNVSEWYGGGLYALSGGLSMTSCTFSGNSSASGGAVYDVSGGGGSVIDNCTFTGNTATDYGGAIANEESYGTITNCTFSGNSAYRGGGMDNNRGTPLVTDCTFDGNHATLYGGGIHNWNNAAPTIRRCTIRNNSADENGGGIHCVNASPLITENTISSNTAPFYGGGIRCDNASPTIRNNTIARNHAYYGGGISCYLSSPAITKNTITGNTTKNGGNGGGIESLSSSPNIVNNVITGNSVPGSYAVGGGIYFGDESSPAIVNNTITHNTAGFNGGGIGCNRSTAILVNTIIASNSSGIFSYGNSSLTMQSNCVYGNTAYNYSGLMNPTDTNGNISANPRFTQVAGTGPDGLWGTEDDVIDFRLRAGSPCIDAGDNTKVPAGVMTDAAGNPRFVDAIYKNDTGVGTPPIVDMGAYEAGPVKVRLYVNAAATGAGTGLNWANAFTQLRDAWAAATDNPAVAEIWVAAGTYAPAAPGGSRAATFRMSDGLAVYGGFAGNENPATFNLADRNFAAHPTILSGDLDGNDGPNFANNAENSYHVVTASGTDEIAVLDGFTIQGGNAGDTANPNDRGGGLFVDYGKPTLVHCIFANNAALFAGGAMYGNGNLRVTVQHCRFLTNISAQYGGALAVANNYYVDITDCTFVGNSASLHGGAICHGLPRMTVGNTSLTSCVFTSNASSGGNGGAVYGNSQQINNCMFTGNTAANGGAFYGITLKVMHSTFRGNTATATGGGIRFAGGVPKVSNCILWSNSDSSGVTKNAQLSGGQPRLDYCCVQASGGVFYGRHNIDVDPLFVDPASLDNVRLLPGSPCADSGAALAKLYYQAGTTQVDNTLDTGIVDMGYHYGAVIAYDGDGNVDSTDFDVFSACYNGPTNLVQPDCYQADFNNDHYVDATDFDTFSACYNGPVNLPGCR